MEEDEAATDFHGGYLSEIFNHPVNDVKKFNCVDDYSFSRLPELRSLENCCLQRQTNLKAEQGQQQQQQQQQEEEATTADLRLAKRLRSSNGIDDHKFVDLKRFERIDDESRGCDLRTLERIMTTPLLLPNYPRLIIPSSTSTATTVILPRLTSTEAARQRRKRISDRTRELERLMPWTEKMDIASMLGEAYKYVEFLAAQVDVLRSMPPLSPPRPPNGNDQNQCLDFGGEFGRLEQMNRERVLHVLMNSPISQTTLYSRKLCLCSIEQFEPLMNAAMREMKNNHHHLSQIS